MGNEATRIDVDGHLDRSELIDDSRRPVRLDTTPIGVFRLATVGWMGGRGG